MVEDVEYADDNNREVALFTKARDSLYLSLDRLQGQRHHVSWVYSFVILNLSKYAVFFIANLLSNSYFTVLAYQRFCVMVWCGL